MSNERCIGSSYYYNNLVPFESMFRNNLIIALRTLAKQKGFTFINIIGLAIGLTACILILLWVQDELSYDRYHQNANRLYIVGLDAKLGNQEFNAPSTPTPLAFTMVEEFDQVEQATRLLQSRQTIVKYKDRIFSENKFYYADSTFLEMFTFPLIHGNPNTVLDRPNTVVITEKIATKYFGREDPLGKTLKINNQTDLEITGICKEVPHNSHIRFEFLASYSPLQNDPHTAWGSNNIITYVLLKESYQPEDLNENFRLLLDTYFGPLIEMVMNISLDEFYKGGNRYYYFLESIKDIHLQTRMSEGFEGNSKMIYVYVLSIIAFFILVIACFNFINLSTARSSLRAKEVGIRKVLGSNRKLLIYQFLGESMLLSFIAMLIAALFVELLLPQFNQLSQKELTFQIFRNPLILPSIFGLTLFSGLVAGSYAAFIQSSYNVMEVLKGIFSTGMKSGSLRNALVVFQFSVSVFLIICTFTVFSQIRYIHNKDLGFKADQVLIVNKIDLLNSQQDVFKQRIQNIPGITSVSISRNIPGRGFSGNGILIEGGIISEVHILGRFLADYDILETFELTLLEGRYFSPDRPGDSIALVINESAVQSLTLNDPLNQRLLEPADSNFTRPIIGIVKDFHFSSLHDNIRPLAMEIIPSQSVGRYLVINASGTQQQQIIHSVRKVWEDMVIDQPFDYFFMDDDFYRVYKQEQRLGTLYTLFSVLAVFIACLGLFGLTSFITEQKTKDIGIRKAMGADVTGIVFLLSKEFNKWVLLANLFAWPAAYFLMKNWLQNFAFKVNLSLVYFLAAALITLVIALLTVSYQSLKAALKNPADSLRYE